MDKLELPNFSKANEKYNSKNLSNSINKDILLKEKEEEIKCYKLEFKNKNNSNKFIKSMINKYNRFEIFSILCKKIILNKFRNQLFMCFKSRNEILNLEKLNFIRYDISNQSTESYIIKEKYLKDEEVIDNKDTLKPFTVIKINKFTPGDSSKSKFFEELLAQKETSHLGNKIQDKLDELQNKIKEFEDFNALIQKKFFNKDII